MKVKGSFTAFFSNQNYYIKSPIKISFNFSLNGQITVLYHNWRIGFQYQNTLQCSNTFFSKSKRFESIYFLMTNSISESVF